MQITFRKSFKFEANEHLLVKLSSIMNGTRCDYRWTIAQLIKCSSSSTFWVKTFAAVLRRE